MMDLAMMLVVFGILTVGYLWSGFVLTYLWGWFIVPLFGLPPLSIPQAIGVVIVASYMTHQYIKSDETANKKKEAISAMGHIMMKPAIAFLVGWVVKQFI